MSDNLRADLDDLGVHVGGHNYDLLCLIRIVERLMDRLEALEFTQRTHKWAAGGRGEG